MVHLIHYDRKTGALHVWPYVFAQDAEETLKVLPGDLKYVVRNVQDLVTAELPTLVLKEIYILATGKELRWKNRIQSAKKVYTAMSKLTREEVKNAKAKAPAVAPSPEEAKTVVAAENETAEQKAERERLAAEAKAEKDRKAEEKRLAAEQKKQQREENARKRKEDAENRKKKREEAKAARLAAKANGPTDCPHNAVIKVIKEAKDFPQFKGNRALIVAQLKDGQTVGEFVKLAAKAAPGGGVGDVRIYLEKGMIELVKPEPTTPATQDPAATSTEGAPAEQPAEPVAVE